MGMLITKELTMQVHGRKIKHYLELGYDIPMHMTRDGLRVKEGTELTVRIEDVPHNSHETVLISCDYCGKQYYTRYDGYMKRKQGEIGLDCCIDCKSVKNKELNIQRYGVENQFQREEVKEKIKDVLLEKYGVDHPMRSEEIKTRAVLVKSENGGPVSKQQLYIHNLIGGELNYTDNSTFWFMLDIAFPDKKIYVEYDGSGHDAQVKMGRMTRCEFLDKEHKRYEMLKRHGWKMIRLISSDDYLPEDSVIVELVQNAMKTVTLSSDMCVIRFEKESKGYGKMRRITNST